MNAFPNTAKYIFHEGPLPAGVTLDYEPAIFNLYAFSASQEPVRSISFYTLDQKRNRAAAEIHFQIADHLARSPFKAPFGSMEFGGHIHPELLYRFLEYTELRLKDKGVTDIFLTNPPRAYAPEKLSLLETFLLNRKYVVSDAEVAVVIEVSSAHFSDLIRHSERLKIRQAQKAGLTFDRAGIGDLPEVYDFISRCHHQKGYKIPMTLEALNKTAAVFPDQYMLFAVRQNEKLAAAAVSIRVSRNILYNFLTNHDRELNHLSPAVGLMEGIYDFCRTNSIRLFDLGTSALEGQPNFPLLDFKLHVGGGPTSKFSFHKKIG